MNKKGDIPGWAWVLGLVLALVTLIVVLWILSKGGQIGVSQIRDIFG